MKIRLLIGVMLAAILVSAIWILSRYGGSKTGLKTSTELSETSLKKPVAANYGAVPLHFETNAGQVDESVKFLSRGSGFSLFLTQGEAVLALQKTKDGTTTASQTDIFRMSFTGANPLTSVTGEHPIEGKTNYFNGTDPAKWKTGIENYEHVRYSHLYHGIDLVYYGSGQQLEYDLIVAPNVSTEKIKISVAGTDDVAVDANGDLIFKFGENELRQQKPLAYQRIDGERKEVKARYEIAKAESQTSPAVVSFIVGEYDHSLPLVIDPMLVYSSYLGGIGSDFGNSIAVDVDGNAYITGDTTYTDFPTANALQNANVFRIPSAFVTKVNAAGTAMVYSTYLNGTGTSGSGNSSGKAITVDAVGNAYVTGTTDAPDFPLSNPFQTTGFTFVTKLNPSGSSILYSTRIGGSGSDEPAGIKVNGAGNAFIAGRTSSRNFPLVNPFQAAHGGGDYDAFVAKFSPSGSSLVYSTYLGGVGTDEASGIAVDASDNAYVTGRVFSANFPTANAFQSSRRDSGFGDAFVTKFNPAGNTLAYSTFLGGNRTDAGADIAVDSSGNAYVTGDSGSGDFPTLNAFQSTPGNTNLSNDADAFVTKLSPAGNSLVYSTYLGGSDVDFGLGIAVDTSGSAYVTGDTRSSNFPLKDALPGTGAGSGFSASGFATKFSPNGQALSYSSYINETNGISSGRAIAVDNDGIPYLTGTVQSAGFPTVNPFQPAFAGNIDAFVMKIGPATVTPGDGTLVITPNHGGDNGVVNVSVGLTNGRVFQTGVGVKLTRTGETDIVANPVGLDSSGSTVLGSLDLRGAAQGAWSVVVTNPDNTSRTINNGFTVEAGRSPDLWAEVVGRSSLRAGRRQTFTVSYGNRGNVNAFGVPLTISFPKNLRFELLTPLAPGKQPADQPPINFDDFPLQFDIDDESFAPLVIGIVSPDSSGYVSFTLEAPVDSTLGAAFNVQVRIGDPLLKLADPSANLGFRDDGRPGSVHTFTLTIDTDCFLTNIETFFKAIDVPKHCKTEFFENFFLSTVDTVTLADTPANGIDTGNAYQISALNRLLAPSLSGLITCTVVPPRQVLQALLYKAVKGCLRDSRCLPSFPNAPATPEAASQCMAITVVSSSDPNDKVGANGAAAPRYVANERLPYSIYFENIETATAAAQEIVVTDQLDPAKFDLSTFGFGSIAFGSRRITLPSNSTEFRTDVDLRPAQQLIVRIDAKLDTTTGLLRWTFTSLDPATGMPTDDPTAGFLPPNHSPPEGDGNVTFSVQPKAGLATGTQVRNRARIVFDANAPIDTPEWMNTIDSTKPSSSVQALPPIEPVGFTLAWSGIDAASGINTYTIYVSRDGGPFDAFLTNTSDPSVTVSTLEPGHTYRFYSIARDRAGNIEHPKTNAEATTSVVPLVSVSGRILAPNGTGQKNAAVTITDAAGVRRKVMTNSFGFYQLSDVLGSGTYTITVSSKRYRFGPRSLQVTSDVTNVDFVGQE